MEIFKKQNKKVSVEETINEKSNKEKLEKAGFGFVNEFNMYVVVINYSIYIPSEMLKLDWKILKEKILRESSNFSSNASVEAMKNRLTF